MQQCGVWSAFMLNWFSPKRLHAQHSLLSLSVALVLPAVPISLEEPMSISGQRADSSAEMCHCIRFLSSMCVSCETLTVKSIQEAVMACISFWKGNIVTLASDRWR